MEHKHCFECKGCYGYHYPLCSQRDKDDTDTSPTNKDLQVQVADAIEALEMLTYSIENIDSISPQEKTMTIDNAKRVITEAKENKR